MTQKKRIQEAQGFRAVILAAGKGTRMKSALPKVLHKACGRSLLGHVLTVCAGVGATKLIPILGHGRQEVLQDLATYRESLKLSIEDVEQKQLLGTGDALRAALPALEGDDSLVLILNGDGPLVTEASLQALLAAHEKEKADLTLAVMTLENPFGYGRISLSGKNVKKIVEEKEASEKEKKIKLVNGGIYVAKAAFLKEFLKKLQPSKKTGEFYLTDLVALGAAKKKKIRAFAMSPEELSGVNDQEQLAEVAAVLRQRILRKWMLAGVTMEDPTTTYIDADVGLAEGVVLEPGVHLYGKTRVEKGAHIRANSYLEDAVVGEGASIGPFARLRPGTEIGEKAKIGNFVEIKKSRIGAESKVSHLSYIGDAEIGIDVNVGCGFITCNYDGKNKHKTIIGDYVFVGSDVQAVAPLKIGNNAYVASGTTLTRDVPAGSLAIARQKQENKEGYAERIRARMLAIAKKKES